MQSFLLVSMLLLDASPPERMRAAAVVLARRAVARAGLEGRAEARLGARARRAPWLPALSVVVGRSFGTRETLVAAELDTQLRRVDDFRVEARASWTLDRLVFDRDELEIAREARVVAARRRELEAQVIELYFERARLAALPATDDETVAARRLRMAEIEAILQALTGPEAPDPGAPR